MKIRRVLLALAIVAVVACAFELGRLSDRQKVEIEPATSAHELMQAKRCYDALEQASLEPYTKYYFEDCSTRFTAAKELVRLTETADPKVWQYMDWGTYNAEVYARASLASDAMGLEAEAREYRRLAVWAWIKRKTWNYAYQQMMAITPSSDFEEAESELFTYITRVDQAVREKDTHEQSADEIAACRAQLDKVADEVMMARRAQRQKSAEKE
ncbi:MAG TPA: hypothetical protein PK879_09550 [Opitutaceae bacterium]|nr:hypothetical protein [Opitutaceae bacterium]